MKGYNIRDTASFRSLVRTFVPSYVMSNITSSYGPSCEPRILRVIKELLMKKVWCWSSNAVNLTIVNLVSHRSFCQQNCNPATVKKKSMKYEQLCILCCKWEFFIFLTHWAVSPTSGMHPVGWETLIWFWLSRAILFFWRKCFVSKAKMEAPVAGTSMFILEVYWN